MAMLGMPCCSLKAFNKDSLLVSLGKVLQEQHYSPKVINDRFSEKIWKEYLHQLDPIKNIFLESDIAALKRYEHRIDDELAGREAFDFLPAVAALYQKRLAAAMQTDSSICTAPLHFNVHEQIHPDGGTGESYATNEKTWKEKRTALMKYLTLQYMRDDEQAGREKALADITSRYRRLQQADLFTDFAEVICHEMDPHTDYFPPVTTSPSANETGRGNMLLGTALIHRDDKLYGYIYLPSFYLDTVKQFHCSADIAQALAAMNDSHVDGLIIDLRNNPGGSLLEVQAIAGMLVKGEAVVQLKLREAAPSLLKSTTQQPVYNGPLAVMVNSQTASAAELFTAAMQDYGRAVICGSPTFGKGTVQRPFPLKDGYVKVTIEQLFRVNGSSTQIKGITPDILLPDIYKFGQTREAARNGVLPWDSIPAAAITRWQGMPHLHYNVDTLFAAIQEKNNWLAAHDTALVPMDVESYRQFSAERQKNVEALNQLLKIPADRQDQASPASFSFMKDAAAYDRWLYLVQADLFVHTTVGVLSNWVSQLK